MKKNLIAGNWKMYKTPSESLEFTEKFLQKIRDYDDRDILICPPFTSLYPVCRALENSPVKTGAQNVYFEDAGAFTGEISIAMLRDTGVEYVICGHSERRHIFGEADELVNLKIRKVADAGMKPILCIGEKLDEREGGKTFDVIGRQLEKCLAGFSLTENLVIAYEPVWAIGTGKTATPEQAEEVHGFVRTELQRMFNEEIASSIIILYGGSVKPDNIDSLMGMDNIDGALVGGASLDVESFSRIADYGIKGR